MKKKSMREREKKRETVERKKKNHSNMERVGEKNIETDRE